MKSVALNGRRVSLAEERIETQALKSNEVLTRFTSKPNSAPKKTAKQTSSNWMSYLGLVPKATESLGQGASKNEYGITQSGTNEEAKKIAVAALAAVKDDAAMTASSRGKLVIRICLRWMLLAGLPDSRPIVL